MQVKDCYVEYFVLMLLVALHNMNMRLQIAK